MKHKLCTLFIMLLTVEGLPLSGSGNYWKQFPPPAMSNRLSLLQMSSRNSNNNRSNDATVAADRTGSSITNPMASASLYNSSPADLIIEGNTSYNKEEDKPNKGRSKKKLTLPSTPKRQSKIGTCVRKCL